MHIGILKITLNLPASQNLKNKRQIVKSLRGRILNKKDNIAIAEVGDLDLWQITHLGIVCVSNDHIYTQKTLAKILDFIREWQGEYILIDHKLEILYEED